MLSQICFLGGLVLQSLCFHLFPTTFCFYLCVFQMGLCMSEGVQQLDTNCWLLGCCLFPISIRCDFLFLMPPLVRLCQWAVQETYFDAIFVCWASRFFYQLLVFGLFKDVPWKAFFKSEAVWAMIYAHFCGSWGHYTCLSWLPTYFRYLVTSISFHLSNLCAQYERIMAHLMKPLHNKKQNN